MGDSWLLPSRPRAPVFPSASGIAARLRQTLARSSELGDEQQVCVDAHEDAASRPSAGLGDTPLPRKDQSPERRTEPRCYRYSAR